MYHSRAAVCINKFCCVRVAFILVSFFFTYFQRVLARRLYTNIFARFGKCRSFESDDACPMRERFSRWRSFLVCWRRFLWIGADGKEIDTDRKRGEMKKRKDDTESLSRFFSFLQWGGLDVVNIGYTAFQLASYMRYCITLENEGYRVRALVRRFFLIFLRERLVWALSLSMTRVFLFPNLFFPGWALLLYRPLYQLIYISYMVYHCFSFPWAKTQTQAYRV